MTKRRKEKEKQNGKRKREEKGRRGRERESGKGEEKEKAEREKREREEKEKRGRERESRKGEGGTMKAWGRVVKSGRRIWMEVALGGVPLCSQTGLPPPASGQRG